MTKHPLQAPSALAAAVLFLLLGVLNGCAFLAREATRAYMNVNEMFSASDIEFQIKKSFIEKYKDRVNITTTFTVDQAMQNPAARIFDGDLHMAGRAPEIGLSAVAEIANGALAKRAADLVHSVEGKGVPLKISGVWRIWAEHAGRAKQEQGTPLPAATSNNPGHIFEIHPITRINNIGVLDTFKPVEGYMPGGARSTFEMYEKAECTLTVKPKTVSMVTQKGLYNDVEFLMEITDARQIVVPGGRFVIASAMDLKGDLLVKRLRMVFASGTPPEKAVKFLKRGDRLHVYGLPRMDFAEVSRRVRGSRTDPTLLTKPLPYEIIIQGVYKDEK
ncbi:MAG: hypothetical protein NT147_00415 [Candidatus Aminicenantes bacterium]|nr:hypothetical protein [Candidatus Aminicenantes bacterium]